MLMTAVLRRRLLLICAVTVASMRAGCGEETTSPSTGLLRVTASTTGAGLDADGYVLGIDGVSLESAGARSAERIARRLSD